MTVDGDFSSFDESFHGKVKVIIFKLFAYCSNFDFEYAYGSRPYTTWSRLVLLLNVANSSYQAGNSNNFHLRALFFDQCTLYQKRAYVFYHQCFLS
jgi:hypothetical protein